MSRTGVYYIILKKQAFVYPTGKIIYIGIGQDVDKSVVQKLGKRLGPATFLDQSEFC